jgi:hypothetical protein
MGKAKEQFLEAAQIRLLTPLIEIMRINNMQNEII